VPTAERRAMQLLQLNELFKFVKRELTELEFIDENQRSRTHMQRVTTDILNMYV
jgi:hypothetical protein